MLGECSIALPRGGRGGASAVRRLGKGGGGGSNRLVLSVEESFEETISGISVRGEFASSSLSIVKPLTAALGVVCQ